MGDGIMINALHLTWIISAAATFGFILAALFAVGNDENGQGRR